MSFSKIALTNYYNFAKKEKKEHKCNYCNRTIKGWGISTCSECNREFCRSHMEPSIGDNKKCPDCRNRRKQFMEKNASVEAFKIAENNYNNLNPVDARLIEEKLFKSIFAGVDLFKFAQEEPNEEISEPETEEPQQEIPLESPESEITEPTPQVSPQPSIEQTIQPAVEQDVPGTPIQQEPSTDQINEVALDAVGEQIFESMSSADIDAENAENLEVIENLFSNTFDNLFSFAQTDKNIRIAVPITQELANMNKDLMDEITVRAPYFNNFFDSFKSARVLYPDEVAELNRLGTPPVKPEFTANDTNETFNAKLQDYLEKLAPFETFMVKVNTRMGLQQRLDALQKAGNTGATVFKF